MTTLLVPISYVDGAGTTQVSQVSLEAITAARSLGAVHAVAITAPEESDALLATLSDYGVERLYRLETERVAHNLGMLEVDVVSALACREEVAGILLGDSVLNREIAGRLAVRLGSGVALDVVGVDDPAHVRHAIFGSQLDVNVEIRGPYPVVVLRSGVVEAIPAPQSTTVDVHDAPAPHSAVRRTVTVESRTAETPSSRPALTQATVVVAGGRGVGSAEGFEKYVDGLADQLGAAVGATRDAVDLGYCPAALQIGQTGVTVNPDLYIALGISGAIQHRAGMQNSKHIVVVNNDADAAIFGLADVGIVGQVENVVPQLIDLLGKQK